MTSSPNLYMYDVLQGDEFRLLELHPGAGNDPLVCQVRVASLSTTPYFQAVSYCWGNGPRSTHVICGNEVLLVTSDLAIALQHLRSATDERMLWIDQICINQEDEVEKTTQVNMMRTIYSRASDVLIWLGAGEDQMHLALDLIGRTAVDIFSTRNTMQTTAGHGVQSEVQANFAAVQLSAPDSPEWTAYRAFFHLPWFTRVWTYQELTVAQRAMLIYGDNLLPWARFVVVYAMAQERCKTLPSGLSYLSDVPQVIPTMFFGNRLSRNAHTSSGVESVGRPTQELFNLVRILRKNGATDPRDKIYALLGVAHDLDVSTPKVDYKRHFRWVYCDFTKWFIQRYSDLAVLSLVSILPEMGKQGRPSCSQLPSWCPDFRNVSLINNMRVEQGPVIIPHNEYRAYNATGASSTTLIVSENMLLSLHGLHVGRITELTEPPGNLTGNTAISERVVIGGQWYKRAEAHSADGTYAPTGESILLAFSRLRVGDYLPSETNAKQRRQRQKPLTYDMLQPGNITYSNTDGLIHAAAGDVGNQILKHTTRQRMLFTDSGYMGLCHRSCEVGDDVYLLIGSDMPAILRRLETGFFQWKGLSYVHGIMDGEYLLRFRKDENQMTNDAWLYGLNTGPLPFKTEVVTLV